MKYFIFPILFFVGLIAQAQTKYITKTGQVTFEASVPSFEEVKAKNSSVTAILNADNGEFAALILVKGFRFKNALMEEHFNENYAESDKYPKATLKGQIKDFDVAKFKAEENKFYLSGELTFHGVAHKVNNILITIAGNDVITMSGDFKTSASNFDIKIPKIVSNKISEEIDVFFNFELKKK